MRRYFFRPTITKLLLSFFLAVFSYLQLGLSTTLPQPVEGAGFLLSAGIAFAYIFIGPTNPILKFIVLFVFWFIVSWVVYMFIWAIEFIYVKIVNSLMIKIRYTHK